MDQPQLIVTPSPDRQTPSTDQLFSVRALTYKTSYDERAPDNEKIFTATTLSADLANSSKHFVAPNSVVIGSRHLKYFSSSTGSAKRRAVQSPVYDVFGSIFGQTTFDITGDNVFKNMRVFGVAPDGIDATRAGQIPANHDASGRFSVIHHGIATITCPRMIDGPDGPKTARYGFHNKKIGDFVIVDLFETARPYKVQSYPNGMYPIPVAFVPRDDAVLGNRAIPLDRQYANINRVAAGDKHGYLDKVLSTCLVGTLLSTGGNRRNEITVQLRVNSGHHVITRDPRAAIAASIGRRQFGIAGGFGDAVEPTGEFAKEVQKCLDNHTGTEKFDGNSAGSTLGFAAAIMATKLGHTIGSIPPGMSPKTAAACYSQATNAELGIGPDLEPIPGTVAAQLMGSDTAVAATPEQLSAIDEVVSELIASNTSTSGHSVTMNGVTAKLKDLPEEVVASRHKTHPKHGTVIAPEMVRDLTPEGTTLCPLLTAGVENRKSIQESIKSAVECARRAGGACLHTSEETTNVASALERMIGA
jgi:hypothetical protein